MPDWFKKLTESQKWAAYRHYITFFAGILATLGVLTATQQQDLLSAFDSIFSGAKQVLGGLIALATIFGPIINGWIASHRASPTEQIKAVAAMVNDPAAPPVKGVITEPTPAGVALARSIDGPVVSAGTLAAAQIANAPTTAAGRTA